MKRIVQSLSSALVLLLFVSCERESVKPDPVIELSADNQLVTNQVCQQYFYYYGNQLTSLGTAFTNELVIGFKNGTDLNKKIKVLSAYPAIHSIQRLEDYSGGQVTIVSLQPGVTCSEVDGLLAALPQDNHIDFAGAFFQYLNFPGAQVGLTNTIVVTLHSTTSQTHFSNLLAQTRSNIVFDLGFGTYVIKLTKQAPMNTLQTANYLFETGLFEAAEPDFIIIQPPL